MILSAEFQMVQESHSTRSLSPTAIYEYFGVVTLLFTDSCATHLFNFLSIMRTLFISDSLKSPLYTHLVSNFVHLVTTYTRKLLKANNQLYT